MHIIGQAIVLDTVKIGKSQSRTLRRKQEHSIITNSHIGLVAKKPLPRKRIEHMEQDETKQIGKLTMAQ